MSTTLSTCRTYLNVQDPRGYLETRTTKSLTTRATTDEVRLPNSVCGRVLAFLARPYRAHFDSQGRWGPCSREVTFRPLGLDTVHV